MSVGWTGDPLMDATIRKWRDQRIEEAKQAAMPSPINTIPTINLNDMHDSIKDLTDRLERLEAASGLSTTASEIPPIPEENKIIVIWKCNDCDSLNPCTLTAEFSQERHIIKPTHCPYDNAHTWKEIYRG